MVGETLPPFIGNATPFDTVESGFATVISSHPAKAISAASIETVICVALTNVVARMLPLKLTIEPLTKLLPFTVRVNEGPPAVVAAGESVVIASTGIVTCCVTVFDALGAKFASPP
jgi:hypothetical protein